MKIVFLSMVGTVITAGPVCLLCYLLMRHLNKDRTFKYKTDTGDEVTGRIQRNCWNGKDAFILSYNEDSCWIHEGYFVFHMDMSGCALTTKFPNMKFRVEKVRHDGSLIVRPDVRCGCDG